MNDDGVNKTLNEMRLTPEQLQQYSDQAKMMVPELKSSDQQSENLISPADNLDLLRHIKSTQEEEYVQHENQDEEESHHTSVSSTITKESYTNNNNYYWLKVRLPLLVFCIVFIILMPKISISLNKIFAYILSMLDLNKFIYNIFLQNIFKGLIASLVFYLVNLLYIN